MRRRVLLLGCVLAVLAIATAANAGLPSFRGYTGLVLVPTADALCKGHWNAGVFFEDVSSETVNDYVFNFGVSEGVEVGFDRFQYDDNQDPGTLLNAKWSFIPETDQKPGVAVGIIDLTNDLETTVYFVASKSLGETLEYYEGELVNTRVHIGFGGGQLRSLFVGASGYLGNRLQITGEWDSTSVQAGGRLRVTPSLTVHAGWFDVFNSGNARASFGAGVSYLRAF